MPSFKSTWQTPLPEDEIARQQAVKQRLLTGVKVGLQFEQTPLGEFIYSGIWDTMHTFYPAESNPLSKGHDSLRNSLSESKRRYCRRDLKGREFLQLPYTLLADVISEFLD